MLNPTIVLLKTFRYLISSIEDSYKKTAIRTAYEILETPDSDLGRIFILHVRLEKFSKLYKKTKTLRQRIQRKINSS
jgi:hypothetical protein